MAQAFYSLIKVLSSNLISLRRSSVKTRVCSPKKLEELVSTVARRGYLIYAKKK